MCRTGRLRYCSLVPALFTCPPFPHVAGWVVGEALQARRSSLVPLVTKIQPCSGCEPWRGSDLQACSFLLTRPKLQTLGKGKFCHSETYRGLVSWPLCCLAAGKILSLAAKRKAQPRSPLSTHLGNTCLRARNHVV